MNYCVKEIAPSVWRVDIAGAVRIVSYRTGCTTFAPWDICTSEGRRLWASTSLESAFRWIGARMTSPPSDVLLQQLAACRSRLT